MNGEVKHAQRENKKIIPCFYNNIKDGDIKRGLNEIHGVIFLDKFELVINLVEFNQVKIIYHQCIKY